MELQEVVLDKEVFHEELKILKMRVAKLEELQPRDTGELSGTEGQYDHRSCEGCWNQKFEMQLRNIKGCHERLRVNRDDLAKELEKEKHDRKKPSETWTRLEEFDDVEDLLTFRRPNPCYIPTLDATFVSCHLFDVFPDSHK